MTVGVAAACALSALDLRRLQEYLQRQPITGCFGYSPSLPSILWSSPPTSAPFRPSTSKLNKHNAANHRDLLRYDPDRQRTGKVFIAIDPGEGMLRSKGMATDGPSADKAA